MAGLAYPIAELIGAACTVLCCVAAPRRPGRPALAVSRVLAIVLAADAVAFLAPPLADGRWSLTGSLPLQLCDLALLVAAVACWWPSWWPGVELTWFWGLAGCLQAVATPDLYARFAQLDWFEFVVGHLGVVMAAVYLVVGLRRVPGRWAAARVFAITAGFTACVAVVDWRTGANYMYLRRIPGHSSLLSLLGPWPYYIASATGVAIALFAVLSVPFWVRGRRHAGSSPPGPPPIGSGVATTHPARERESARLG